MEKNKALHIIIRGKVQGVGFRWSTMQKAFKLDVKGWIRNNPDGSVEGVFEGDEKAVDDLVRWCRRGPVNARVAELFFEEIEFTGRFLKFEGY